MCGIVGYIGNGNARDIVLNGLALLEYRGYDSAGIALRNKDKFEIFKDIGRVEHLKSIVDYSFDTHLGIGHTRWATHGIPNKINSHPHVSQSGRFMLVHNGVIENYKKLKIEYLKNYNFVSETDSEVIVNLIELFSNDYEIEDAILETLALLEGSYALLIIDTKNPDKLYFAKNRTPLVIGSSKDGVTLASDVIPLVGVSDEYVSLKDRRFGYVTKDSITIMNYTGKVQVVPFEKVNISNDEFNKGTYKHYMIKEINEQPSTIRYLISNYFNGEKIEISNEVLELIKNSTKINLVACGTSMYASYMAKYFFEKLCRIPSEVFMASELVYSQPLILDKPVFIYLSQSGETADSIAVMKKFKDMGFPSICITNTVTSSMALLADYVLDIYAGPELAVASTKAYIAQIVVCAILAKALANKKTKLKTNLIRVASAIDKVIENEAIIIDLAEQLYKETDIFYIGRGIDYWASLEAALKLKEISYIHTEAFSSGELKHGSIALIKKGTPVIAICTQEGTNSIVRSNLTETTSRGAKGIVISMESMSENSDDFVIPNVAHYLTPLVSIVVCQLLAYHIARLRGNDIDKPKNLAKSVTVE